MPEEEQDPVIGICLSLISATLSAYSRLLYKKTPILLKIENETGKNQFPFGYRDFYKVAGFVGEIVATIFGIKGLKHLPIAVKGVVNLWQVPIAIFFAQYQYAIKSDWYTRFLTAAVCIVSALAIYFYHAKQMKSMDQMIIIYNKIYKDENSQLFLAFGLYFTVLITSATYLFYSMNYVYHNQEKIAVYSLVTIAGILSISLVQPVISVAIKIFFINKEIKKLAPEIVAKKLANFPYYDDFLHLTIIVAILSIVLLAYALRLSYGYLDTITVATLVPTFRLFGTIIFGILFFGDLSEETNLPMFALCITLDLGLIYALVDHNSATLTKEELEKKRMYESEFQI